MYLPCTYYVFELSTYLGTYVLTASTTCNGNQNIFWPGILGSFLEK